MEIYHSFYITSIILLQLFGTVVFLKGFFPVKHPVPGRSSWREYQTEPSLVPKGQNGHYPRAQHHNLDTAMEDVIVPLFGRVVFLLIDALRADFVLPTPGSDLPRMEFVSELIEQNSTLSFMAKAHPPTVTMPRIKAITTGGIPGFVDVVLNFGSEALLEDNVISQLNRSGKNIVFYGDDTWMKLFPDHFIRSDGTTSFFVTDYTEVDNNVTRHLNAEMVYKDWDVLILHYLGLDHIGHLAGPRSPLVQPKLKEMDMLIQAIYENIVEQDMKEDLPTLLVLCGDHGMSDQGSHGGSSMSETTTPLVFMSSLYEEGNGFPYSFQEFEQIDLAPTLALILGVPVPQNSLGNVILDALHGFTMREKLRAVYINAQQILRVFQQNSEEDYEGDPGYLKYQRAMQAHTQWLRIQRDRHSKVDLEILGSKVLEQYSEAIEIMRARVASTLATYDLHAMGSGIFILWTVLIAFLYGHSNAEGTIELPVTAVSVVLVPTIVGVLQAVHVTICTGPAASDLLCDFDVTSCLVSTLIFCLIGFWMTIWLFHLSPREIWSHISQSYSGSSFSTKFLTFGIVIHTFSLLSSSFVEEEHQTWYFLTVAISIILSSKFVFPYVAEEVIGVDYYYYFNTTYNPKKYKSQKSDSSQELNHDEHGDTMETLTENNENGEEYYEIDPKEDRGMNNIYGKKHRKNRRRQVYKEKPKHDSKGLKIEQLEEVLPQEAYMEPQTTWNCILASVGLVMLCRFCRIWNRTGDKWVHLPDLGDWLVRPDNKSLLSMMIIGSIFLMRLVRCRNIPSAMKVMFCLGGAGVYCFRAANGAVVFPVIYGEDVYKGVHEARLVYSIILCMIFHTIYTYRRTPISLPDSKNDTYYHSKKNRILENNAKQEDKDELDRRTILFENFLTTWTLFCILSVRPHNICLIALMCVQEFCVSFFLKHYTDLSNTGLSLLYVWMGQAAFYYQGNSNSIATVDVSSGYIGLDDFSPTIIGILMCLNTYACPIFWIMSLLVEMSKRSATFNIEEKREEMYKTAVQSASYTFCLTRALVLAVYTILVSIQRYHLFVWTVFSPKLLYEGMWTLVLSILSLCVMSTQRLISNANNSV